MSRPSQLRSYARSPRAIETLEKRQLLAAHILGSATVYPTIQAAVDAAVAGQTITVDAGVYSELVAVHKTLTIRGPRFGVDGRSNARNDRSAEAIVNGSLGAVTGLRSTAFFLNANNIILDGFTMEGQNGTNTYNAGISMGAGKSGIQVLNNIVQNNATGINVSNASSANPAVIRNNLFRENNQPGPHTGRAIYSDGSLTAGLLDNVVIDNNVFFKNYGSDPNFAVQPAIGIEAQSTSSIQRNIRISNNIFDYNGKGVLIYNASALTVTNNVFTHNRDTTSGNLRLEGGMNNVAVRDNLFYANGARAIYIDQKVIKLPNQNFTISNNNFFGNGKDAGAERTAIKVEAATFTGTLDATGNYYGAVTGPSINFTGGAGTGDSIWTGGNSVNYSGFKTDAIATGSTLFLPYYTRPLDITAPIMFADYDHGGQAVSYSDTTTANQGNVLHRYQAVDLQATSDPGFGISSGNQLAWVKAGEWVKYTVSVPVAGVYDLQIRLANANTAAAPGKFHLEVDGINVSGTITPTSTGSNTTYVTQTVGNIALPSGVHVLRFVFDVNGSTTYVSNFNWFSFSPPAVIPPPPAAPTNFAASASGPTSVGLTWSDNSSNETGFIIERSSNGIDFFEIATTGENATGYFDTTVAPNSQYVYRVRAENMGGDSDYSNTDDATTPALATPPAAPSGLAAAAAGWSVINLTWTDNASDETGFIIERSLNGIDGWTQIATPSANATAFSDTGVAASTQYFYRVRATSSGGESGNSNTASATTPAVPTAPAAPSNLAATAVSQTQINLSWMDNADNETGFVLERSLNGIDGWTSIGTAAANATTFNNTSGLSAGTQYFYRVRASNAVGDSANSNVASATTLATPPPTIPAAPSNLVATVISSSQINLAWKDNATDETGFIIDRSLNGIDGWTPVGNALANVTTFNNTALTAGTKYFYRVRAVNGAGQSANSNTASATTTPAGPTFIAGGSTWKYLDNGSDAGTTWRARTFNDSTWKSGAAQLGYGDGDETTIVSYGTNKLAKYITTYFRKSFDIADPAAIATLAMRIIRDDGAVVYLNGTEIYRTNMPTGTITYTTVAPTPIGNAAEYTWYGTSVNPALLVAGTNVIAVEIHQDSPSSPDVSFDFELTGTMKAPAAPATMTVQPPTSTSTTGSTSLLGLITELA